MATCDVILNYVSSACWNFAIDVIYFISISQLLLIKFCDWMLCLVNDSCAVFFFLVVIVLMMVQKLAVDSYSRYKNFFD